VYKGVGGKGSALKTVMDVASILEARICVTLDADTRSISPYWVQSLTEPISRHNYGYVTPYYLRDKHDGTITNFLVRPLVSALFGISLGQPIGGDFAMSGGLALALARQRVWNFETDINRFGIDLWMTTTAINEGVKVGQAALGVKIHDVRQPGKDLTGMFKQVVGTLFGLMRKYEMKWKTVFEVESAKVFGKANPAEPEPVEVSHEELIAHFQKAALKYETVWARTVAPENFTQLKALVFFSDDVFKFPAELWAKIAYDYAIAYNFSDHGKDELLESLVPIYLGMIASFVIENEEAGRDEAYLVIEEIARVFEKTKPYLLKHWAKAKEGYLGRPKKVRVHSRRAFFEVLRRKTGDTNPSPRVR
ncbi:MAG: glycosyl transferase family 2, partial [Terriglobia bacterium]